MSQVFRRAQGGRIDRNRVISFSFNGRTYDGFDGDTLASALLANGVRVVSRSFKFHRPRGIFSAGAEECNALLTVNQGNGDVPLVRATLARLSHGLKAYSQNCFPSVNFDLGRILDFTRRLWPAGFYNKMFKWPSWHAYEWAIRGVAGLGRVPQGEDGARYRHGNIHCDVLIVGAGPAGLRRALDEARSGVDVLIAEQDFAAGGRLLFDARLMDGISPERWLENTLQELRQFSNVKLMLNTTVAGYYDHNVLTAHDRSASGPAGGVETFWKIRAGKVVLATGAIEQALLFGNNDKPGVMLASAMQQYINRYGVLCASSAVAVVNNDEAWHSVLALQDGGISIPAIVDTRNPVNPQLMESAAQRSIPVYPGAAPVRVRGLRCVRGFEFLDAQGTLVLLPCDGVAVSGGFSPTVHLYSQAGGKLRYDDRLACFVPDSCKQNVEMLGSAAGGFAAPENYAMAPRVPGLYRSDAQWVDLQHDVLVSDIELAVRENFVSVEHMKRYTTTGMSVDQGKTSNLNALSILAHLTGKSPGNVGTTTYRPQYMPVTMGAIAGNRRGEFYKPTRRLALHDWHRSQHAEFDDYGAWKRPAYYGIDMQAAIEREVHAVRNRVGLFDASPIGKIEVKGPDAAEFLNRIYLNTVPTLQLGKIRYGLMLTENGSIFDDGVFIRIANDHFLINSTSAAAERVTAWLEQWHQCEWPNLELVISPVTSQWAVATLAGPEARRVLESIAGIGDVSAEGFPHMSFKQGQLDEGPEFRLQRVSFTGELSFELSVPAGYANVLFTQLNVTGERWGLTPFGIEALDILRLEKGFLHVGGDTDGTTNPYDVGMGRIVANKASDFVGKRSLLRQDDQRQNRRQLVGISTLDSAAPLRQGAHVVTGHGDNRRSEGFVTTAAMSPTLGRRIGLGMVESGFSRLGEEIQLFDMDECVAARIVSPCAYDPGGERMRA